MVEIIPNWHPIFVHFTVALLSVSLGAYIVALVIDSDQLRTVAKWNLWIGAGITLLTLAAGWNAFNTVEHDDPSHAAMIEHRNWALITVAVLIPVLVWSVMAARKARQLGWGFVALFAIVGALLASTAWHGGELVYRHGLGVMSLPETDAHDHGAHSHDGAAGEQAAHEDGQGHGHDDDHEAQGMMPEEAGDMEMEGMTMDGMAMDEMSMESMPAEDDHDDGHDHTH